MNVNLLVDSIVRQTTILIAQLATTAGARATLAHTANQVFVDLVTELKAQGLGNKVISDMFGLTLRAYHQKIARLSESSSVRGRSLWEALLTHLQESGSVSRPELLNRFSADDEVQIRGVLNDLVDSGLIFRSGRGNETLYRPADPSDYARFAQRDAGERLSNLVWIAIYRLGPITVESLAEQIPASSADLRQAVARLERHGRIRRESTDPPRYESKECVITTEDPAGWEAALFDHYQAMVTAMCTKLRSGSRTARQKDWIGGSTYGFEIWADHPYGREVLGFLQETRERATALRQRVSEYNEQHACGEGALKVIAYVGQTVLGAEGGGDAGEEQ